MLGGMIVAFLMGAAAFIWAAYCSDEIDHLKDRVPTDEQWAEFHAMKKSAEIKTLRKLCGEAAKSIDDAGDYEHDLIKRLRKAAGE